MVSCFRFHTLHVIYFPLLIFSMFTAIVADPHPGNMLRTSDGKLVSYF